MKKIAVLVSLLAALVAPAFAVEQMYVSSHTASVDNQLTLSTGRVQLYKVIVSSIGTGTAQVNLYNALLSTITVLDAAALRDYPFDVTLSSGLRYSTLGTIAPKVTFLYSKQLPPYKAYGTDPYSVLHSTGAYTKRLIKLGRVFLKRVIVGKDGGEGSDVTIYDGNATAASKVITSINTLSESNTEFNVFVSSGLTYSTTGTPNVTFVYGNTR